MYWFTAFWTCSLFVLLEVSSVFESWVFVSVWFEGGLFVGFSILLFVSVVILLSCCCQYCSENITSCTFSHLILLVLCNILWHVLCVLYSISFLICVFLFSSRMLRYRSFKLFNSVNCCDSTEISFVYILIVFSADVLKSCINSLLVVI